METNPRQSNILMAVFALAAILALSLLVFCCATDQQAQRDQAAPRTEETKATPEQEKDRSSDGQELYNPADVDNEPAFLETPPPRYPLFARLSCAEATVTLVLTIDEKGCVEKVEVLHYSGDSKFETDFRIAAVSAGRRYRFKPAIMDGKPVPCMAMVTVKFELE